MQIGTRVKVITTGQVGHVVGPSNDGKIYIDIDNKGWFKFRAEELINDECK